ncbi:MAG: hypothetical protein UW97_C0029G0002 [Parcubacteria group bacterium GW2011_GWA2_45_15]|nr:MAG: hypothetical protein UW97_C0029G0002 [Parcubacteria group bacterium GW2011_GWA2_45_15]
MRGAIYATIAVVLFSFLNVALEQKLMKYNAAALMVCFYAVMVPLAFTRVGFVRITEGSVAFPTGTLLIIAFVFGVVYFFADFSYISAFTAAGASVMTVTTILMMTPVFSSLVKYFYTGGGLPNSYQIAGYILAVVAILLVSKGGG